MKQTIINLSSCSKGSVSFCIRYTPSVPQNFIHLSFLAIPQDFIHYQKNEATPHPTNNKQSQLTLKLHLLPLKIYFLPLSIYSIITLTFHIKLHDNPNVWSFSGRNYIYKFAWLHKWHNIVWYSAYYSLMTRWLSLFNHQYWVQK